MLTVQLSINSGLAALSHETAQAIIVRDGAAKPELIDNCNVRSPPCFCRMQGFVAHTGSL